MADDASGWRFYYKYLHGSQREYVNNLYAAVVSDSSDLFPLKIGWPGI